MVWDLDNTLWTGTLAEDGPEGVVPRADAVRLLRALDERGILNSIASKNDRAPALATLQRFRLSELFVFPQISWGPKSAAIREIAKLIDIGTDTLAFIDDQPFERGEVDQLVPEVETFGDSAIPTLMAHARFDVPVTAEARKRRQSYQIEQKRHEELATSGLDYDEFLRSCRLRLTIAPLCVSSAPRVHELTERTHQLNASGRRYSRSEIDALIDGSRAEVSTYVLSVADRFGDYGIIGFCELDRRAWAINSFFMSCRVQRKRVEAAFFGWLAEEARLSGASEIAIDYRPAPRNGAALTMLQALGFAGEPAIDGSIRLRRATAAPVPGMSVVAVDLVDGGKLAEAGE